MKSLIIIAFFSCLLFAYVFEPVDWQITRSQTIDSLGACQGILVKGKHIYLYGDRETGVMREYRLNADSLSYTGNEVRFTVKGSDVINHPTGVAIAPGQPVFIGNSVRLNKEGTRWKALIYHIDWDKMLKAGTLDGSLVKTITDDACIQGTRPEYVRYKNKWYIATADYGDKANEVRLYDPQALKNADSTSEKNILFKKFTCTPWVQNLHWTGRDGTLILVQNQIEGRKWRLSFIDLEKSIETGTQQVIKVVDTDRMDELEGFALTGQHKGIAVTSSRKNNINFMKPK